MSFMKESNDSKVRPINYVAWLVMLVSAMFVFAMLLPAISAARLAAEKINSSNNLKQHALACHNYESTYRCFPLGADFDPWDKAKHGWTVRLVPFLEQTSLFNEIDMRVTWDSPFNAYLMRRGIYSGQRYGQPKSSVEGFTLQHFMGNPNVFHKSHVVKASEMIQGLSHQWLMGEVDGAYQPWGYPFNWRPLKPPFNTGKGSYGAWKDGFHLAMGDGSVQFLSKATDVEVVNALANAPPVATEDQTTIPNRRFSYAKSELKHEFREQKLKELYKGWYGALIHHDATGKADCVDMTHVTKKELESDGSQRLSLAVLIKDCPSMRELVTKQMLDDELVEQIARLRSLESLYVSSVQLSDEGIESLSRIKTLKSLAYHIGNEASDLDTLDKIRERLPNCKVVVMTQTPN